MAATAAFFVGVEVAPAQAQDPAPADDITVVSEPPGENCASGGIKVTVTTTPEDPEAEPVETVYYVCNGQDGEPGTPGEDGEDGAPGTPGEPGPEGPQGPPGEPGQDGAPGTDGQDGNDGADGNDGVDGADGSDGEQGPIRVPVSQACASAGVKRLRLPSRFANARRVTVIANAKRRTVRVSARRTVRVDLRRVTCGYYPVIIRKKGIRSELRIWHLTAGGASVSRIGDL